MDPSANLPPPPPPRPRSVGGIVAVSVRAYGRRWRELLPLAAVFVVPLELLFLVAERALRDLGGTDVGTSGAAVLAALLWFLISLALSTAQQGAVTWAAMRALLGLEPTLGRAVYVGFRRLWSVLLVGLLGGLAITVGLVLLVVPGLIVLVRLAVVMPVLMVEDARGRAALRRSWRLVRGRSWAVAAVLLLAGLIDVAAGLGVSTLLGLVELPAEVGAAVASIAVTPLFALLIGAVYVDLRARELAPAGLLAAELERATP